MRIWRAKTDILPADFFWRPPATGHTVPSVTPEPAREVTQLLRRWSEGDEGASARLMPLVYEELRQLARNYLSRERGGHTLQPTALVHEAYLRLNDADGIAWEDRAHFFGIAARLMRRVLVDHARARNADKRGADAEKISLEDAEDAAGPAAAMEIVALDGALEEFAKTYPRQSEVVELKFFGGLEAKQIAALMKVSEKTVLRDWSFARLWLHRALREEDRDVA